MPEKLQITIIGLNLIGASAGLALRRYADKVTVVGHDRDQALAGRAKATGAVDRTDWNLINAVSKADRILLALPVNEVRDTLEAIAKDLKPGCVLVDTADVKTPVLQWAAELLPETITLVGGRPLFIAQDLDTGAARADLFQDKLFCLVAGQRSTDSGLRLAADLIEALGGKPFFLDPVEHDGLTAATEQLPALMAGALMQITRTSPSWPDMRKLAGNQFYSSTLLAAGSGAPIAAAATANRDHLVGWLDRLIAELTEMRQLVADGNTETLANNLDEGLTANHQWLNAQASGNWAEPAEATELPTTGSYMRQLIGFGRLDRKPGKPKK